MKNYYLDIETYEPTENGFEPILDPNYFILGCILDDEGNFSYYHTKEQMFTGIMKIIESTTEKITFWGHNHEYDFYGYIKHKLKELLTSEKLNIIRTFPLLAIYDKRVYFLDTMAFLSMSLDDAAKELNKNKTKLEMPQVIQHAFELYPYIQRDCELTKAIVDFAYTEFKELGYKPRKLITLASGATSYLISYITKQKYSGWLLKKGRIHKNEETIPFLRQGSKGGRVEVFEKGRFKNCKYIDINSAYWEAMCNMPFPDLLRERHLYKEHINALGNDYVLSKTGMVEATIKVKKNKIGLLAVRYNKNPESKKYKLIFPNIDETIMRGFWTTYEINFAIENGYELQELHEAVIYEKNLPFSYLKDFINNLWNLRKKHYNNNIKNKFYKLVGNSLYGKFIQRKQEKEFKWIERQDIKQWEEQGWKIESVMDDYCISRVKADYSPRYVSIILGSMITAYTRVELTKHLLKFDRNQIKYCDTDGIICIGDLPKDIVIGNDLGQFKIETEGDGVIIKKKLYRVNDTVKAAGLPRKEQTVENIETKSEIPINRMIGYKDAINRGDFNLIGKQTQTTFSLKPEEEEEHDLIIHEVIV